MSVDVSMSGRSVACLALGGVLSLVASAATAQSIHPAETMITRGRPVSVSPMMRRVDGGQAAPGAAGKRALEGTYWKAIELAGKPTPAQDPKREAHLQFQRGRVSGSDGCNRITGTYQLNGDRVTFGQLAGTQMACVNPGGTEGPFRGALESATRLTIAGDRLELSDAAGTRLAVFAAGRQIVKQWGNIRSYVVKDGHLFLSLMADGGIYEFEPIAGNNP
jgi:heat shock protein HslJ